jgi:plastocyanin
MKKLVAAFLFLSLLTALIAACGGTGSSSGASDTNGTDVHMSETTFVQSSITLTKGSSFNLIDDTNVVHIIQNGSWKNNNPVPSKESGAPTINVQFSGSDIHTVGPFNTAGTYHLYCVVHPGMNLTVIVK